MKRKMQTDTFTVNLKTNKMECVVGGKKYEGLAGFIQSQRDSLDRMRSTTGQPQLLLRDIAVYDFILAGEKPDELADQYFRKKDEFAKRGQFPEKSQIAEALGWDWQKFAGNQ